MIKKFSIHVLAVLICAVSVRASGPESDKKTATVLYSDIVAYINGFPIQTYNIGGRLAATASDLMAHGLCTSSGASEFDLNWNDIFVSDTYEPEPVDKNLVGTIKEKFTYFEVEAICSIGDDRKKIPAIYRSDRPEQIDANVSFVFLSDVVQTLGGMSVYSDQGRTSLVTMPKLYTFEEKLSLFFNYEDRYDFNDYTVGHKGYAFQQGPIEVLHIYYKEGYMRDLLADVPTNAAYRDPAMNGAGYITDITDVNFSEDGKIMTFHYYYGGGKTVTIDLPSAKVVSID